eukprot:1426244-Rhodomonas_salina.1
MGYAAMRCAVLRWAMLLQDAGDGRGKGGRVVQVLLPDVQYWHAYGSTMLRVLTGTDIAYGTYGATRYGVLSSRMVLRSTQY